MNMERLILKEEIVEAIKSDQMLYGKVATVLGVSIPSMRRILDVNHVKLTQAGVIQVLRDHLGKQDNELLTPMQKEKQVA